MVNKADALDEYKAFSMLYKHLYHDTEQRYGQAIMNAYGKQIEFWMVQHGRVCTDSGIVLPDIWEQDEYSADVAQWFDAAERVLGLDD